MDEIQQLAKLQNSYEDRVKERTHIFRKWSTWNWWAKKQSWYHTWAYENAYEPKDLRASVNFRVPIEYDMLQGAPLKALVLQLDYELELLRHERSVLIGKCWFKKDDFTTWAYSIVDIAKATHQSVNALNAYMIRQPWFKPRLEIAGKRYPKTKRKPS